MKCGLLISCALLLATSPAFAMREDAPLFNGTASGNISGNAATVTTNANLTGVITSVGNATSIAAQTGTGSSFVVSNNPTLVAPVLGAASGSSFNITATGAAAMYQFSGTGGLWQELQYNSLSVGPTNLMNTLLPTSATLGAVNVAIGSLALNATTTGSYNTAVGANAGKLNTVGKSLTFVGYGAGQANSSGIGSTAIGYLAGSGITSGQYDTCVGYNTCNTASSTGNGNVIIGASEVTSTATAAYELHIGYNGTDAISATAINTATPTVTIPGTLTLSTALNAANLIGSKTAPTISSGFCSTSPSIVANNGTWAFTIGVGTSCSGSTGTLGMPTAATGWVCSFADVTTPASYVISQTGGTASTVTLTSYARTTGVASNFTASDVIRAMCAAY